MILGKKETRKKGGWGGGVGDRLNKSLKNCSTKFAPPLSPMIFLLHR